MAFSYDGTVPQGPQDISVSQPIIQTNFTSIQSFLDVNHVDFPNADAGKHKLVTFPDNTGPHATGATELNVYNQVYGVSGAQELFLERNAGNPLPFTASKPNRPGYTILPSGILVKWHTVSAIGSGLINFPVAGDLPVFAAAPFLVIVNAVKNAGSPDGFAMWNSSVPTTTTGFNVYISVANMSFSYMAFGTI